MIDITNDLMSDALKLMRITGSLLLVESYVPPWGVSIPDETTLRGLLNVDNDTRVLAFHFVHQGCFTLNVGTSAPGSIREGDVLVGFGGQAHTISQGNLSLFTPLASHLSLMRTAPPPPNSTTSLICGVFLMQDTHLNPLFAGLPPFLHLRRSSIQSTNAGSAIPDLLVHETNHSTYGADYAIQRLLELLCLDVLRGYIGTNTELPQGWLRGIHDPLLAKALFQFHRVPHETWSVSRLAQEANLSPSRFAARFADNFGESCMIYVTKWRLNMARGMLRTTDKNVEEIAYQVGYNNLPAFARVFRRYFGISPAAWRTNRHLHASSNSAP